MPEQCPENGGAGSITEQWLKTRPDVVLGGGAATFAETARLAAMPARPSAPRPKPAATGSSRTSTS